MSDAVGANRRVFEQFDTPRKALLKLFEFGGRPMFYYTDYRRDLASVAEVYRLWKPLRHLQRVFIHDHETLAPGVTVTRYENGEELVCNASPAPFAYRGRTVPSLAFELLDGVRACGVRP